MLIWWRWCWLLRATLLRSYGRYRLHDRESLPCVGNPPSKGIPQHWFKIWSKKKSRWSKYSTLNSLHWIYLLVVILKANREKNITKLWLMKKKKFFITSYVCCWCMKYCLFMKLFSISLSIENIFKMKSFLISSSDNSDIDENRTICIKSKSNHCLWFDLKSFRKQMCLNNFKIIEWNWKNWIFKKRTILSISMKMNFVSNVSKNKKSWCLKTLISFIQLILKIKNRWILSKWLMLRKIFHHHHLS